MKKPMKVMLVLVFVLFANIILFNFIKNYFENNDIKENSAKPISVSTMKVSYEKWQPSITALAEIAGINGVDITTEVPGKIQKIYIKSGQYVNKGDKIIQLHAEEDIAAYEALQAAADMARITYELDKKQYEINVVSKETLELDKYTYDMQQAAANEQKAMMEKKTIRAPFSGRIGIFYFSEGQYLNPGDYIVNLHETDNMYVYFNVPEQNLPQLKLKQEVYLSTDAYPDDIFMGRINSFEAEVNENTHNITIESIVKNKDNKLIPGMYGNIKVNIGKSKKYLTIPQAAVNYNPYGNMVYVVKEPDNKEKKKEEDKKKSIQELIVEQRFITLGDTRGDQVAVLNGLKEGEQIVTGGQLKLKNKARIVINNESQPSNQEEPKVKNQR